MQLVRRPVSLGLAMSLWRTSFAWPNGPPIRTTHVSGLPSEAMPCEDVDFYGGYSKVITPIKNPKLDHESHGILSLSLGPPSRGRTIKNPTETT